MALNLFFVLSIDRGLQVESRTSNHMRSFAWFVDLVDKYSILYPDSTNMMSDISCNLKAWSVAAMYNIRRRLVVLNPFEMTSKRLLILENNCSDI